MHENEAKEKTKENPYLDSITMGSAAKGVMLKLYTDIADTELTEKKIKGLLQARGYLATLGVKVE